jgi:hypothetical protein
MRSGTTRLPAPSRIWIIQDSHPSIALAVLFFAIHVFRMTTFVMALQVAVATPDWPWPAKFVTILLVAIPAMLVSYQFLVRYSVIGAVLNGRRVRKSSGVGKLIQGRS